MKQKIKKMDSTTMDNIIFFYFNKIFPLPMKYPKVLSKVDRTHFSMGGISTNENVKHQKGMGTGGLYTNFNIL
jgi:hypothetical protein